MSTPTRRMSSPHNNGPSSSFLHQLLSEIDPTRKPTVIERRELPTRSSTLQDHPSPAGRRASTVWVGGAPIALNTREQLRAADERRAKLLSRASTGDFEGSSGSASPEAGGTKTLQKTALHVPPHDSSCPTDTSSRPTVGGLRLPDANRGQPFWLYTEGPKEPSPLFFCDADSDLSATASPSEAPHSTVTESTEATSAWSHPGFVSRATMSNTTSKRVRDPFDAPPALSKKLRATTMPGPESQGLTYFGGRAGDNRYLFKSSTFTERATAPTRMDSVVGAQDLPELSSFRPDPATPQGRSRRFFAKEREKHPTPPDTPPFARALHLIDSDLSIYKSDHGDEPREHALCLYCFRMHGKFNRVLSQGYEFCERHEVLRSHYWESFRDF